jgi:hypothetical protein
MNISRNMLLAAFVAFGLPVFADDVTPEAPKTEQVTPEATPSVETSVATEAGDKKEDATEAGDKAEEKTFVAKVCTVVCAPFVFGRDTTVGGIDWVAKTFGAKRFATWLASSSKDKDGKEVAAFFAGKENAISRTLAVAGTAAVVAAAYKAYQVFVAEEDTDEDYSDVDVFETDFDADNN